MYVDFKRTTAEPLISVYLCFYYQATYSALFIHSTANIIHIAGKAGGGEESGENGRKVVEKNVLGFN